MPILECVCPNININALTSLNKGYLIYLIDAQVLAHDELMEYICNNMQENYYVSYDFSPQFYVELCKKGFIATSCMDIKNQQILLPEMQFEYAVLHFEHLHIAQKVKKLLKEVNYSFTQNTRFEEVLNALETYHSQNWLWGKYREMLLALKKQHNENFELHSFEVCDVQNNQLIAGEIGYSIGKSYTSLSGFCTKEKAYNNWGKLQLVLLAQYLQTQKYDFWNLGHACLPYKIDLGAKVYPRNEFLNLWQKSTQTP